MTHEIQLTEDRILRIEQDDITESPDEWENTDIFLVYKHRQFQVDRYSFEPQKIYNWLQSTEEERKEHFIDSFENYFIFTVYAYIHSGVSLSLKHQGCNFDVSSTGFILVNKNQFDFELQRKSDEKLVDKTDEEIALHYAEGLISMWNQYLSGNVYRFNVIHKETCKCCNHVSETYEDSCGGFYSDGIDDEDMIEEMISHIEYEKLEI